MRAKLYIQTKKTEEGCEQGTMMMRRRRRKQEQESEREAKTKSCKDEYMFHEKNHVVIRLFKDSLLRKIWTAENMYLYISSTRTTPQKTDMYKHRRRSVRMKIESFTITEKPLRSISDNLHPYKNLGEGGRDCYHEGKLPSDAWKEFFDIHIKSTSN